MDTCEVTVSVEAGESVEFDTRVVFNMGSPCLSCNQEIDMYLFSGPNVSYICERNDPTNCTGNVERVGDSGGYNFSLQIPSVSVQLSGSRFGMQVVGARPPALDGRNTLNKYFNLVVCRELPDPANGQITHNRIGCVSMANYSCDSGFLPIGDPIIRCQDDGEWSGSPECLSM